MITDRGERMHQVADIEVAKNIMDANKRLADKNLKHLEEKGIFF